MILGLRTAIYPAPDLQQAKKWYSEVEPVTEVGEGIKVAAVTDPFGNRFGVIENPHFNAADVR